MLNDISLQTYRLGYSGDIGVYQMVIDGLCHDISKDLYNVLTLKGMPTKDLGCM
jgi:hypothetical protein